MVHERSLTEPLCVVFLDALFLDSFFLDSFFLDAYFTHSLNDGAAVLITLPPPGEAESFFYFGPPGGGKLQKLLPGFKITRGKIDAAIADAVKDDLKDDKAKLETAQTKLKKLTDPLAGKVTAALKTTKTEKVSALQHSRAELLAKLESTDSAKANERAIIKNKLAGQQLQAIKVSKEYNDLAAKVKALLPKMDKQIGDIEKYTKANVK